MCIFSLFAVNASTHLSIGRRAQFSNPVSQVRMITITLLKWARERSEAVFCNHCRVVVCLLQLAAAVLWISMRSCHLNTPLSATPPVSPSFLSAPLHLCIHLSASYTPPPGGRLCPPYPRPCPHHPPTENTRPGRPTRRCHHRGRGCAKPPLLLRLRHWRHDRLGDGLSLTLRLCLEAATRGAPRRARGVGGGGSSRRRRRNLRDGVRPVGLLRVVRERERES